MTSPTSPDQAGPLELIDHEGETRLAIAHVERMPPFLMSVLSSTDLWMFVASNGGLTAGRQSAEHSLFPYETADRLYERPGLGGPLTMIRRGNVLWRPFDPWAVDDGIVRRLTKSALGDRVGFEEINERLNLGFRYEWVPSDRFGWVRTAHLWSHTNETVVLDVLDGLLDILPAGVVMSTQQRASNLVDAYRHTELHDEARSLAIYSLSSLLTDRAEPAEALRANVVWRTGLPGRTHLAPNAPMGWRRGRPPATTQHLRGRKGAYIVEATVTLAPGSPTTWSMVADVSLDGPAMRRLRADLAQPDLPQRLEQSIAQTHRSLAQFAAAVDGRQASQDQVVALNHLSNALFNGFRGGVLIDEGRIPRDELIAFLQLRNRSVAAHHQAWLQQQPESVDVDALRRSAATTEDPNLARLVDETMPLAFGRRHGDPSRPWNQFSIRTRTASGERAIHYEGNWRDIFQNWEALAVSYPEYLPSMIAKFVNAETVDGFNPYRVSRDGIDWEVPDPEDPWSNIGYWGDHQIIYVLRLLEALARYRPEQLTEMLESRRFSFADVPYRICPYAEMLKNPRDTIRYDDVREDQVAQRVQQVGTDGRLVWHGPEVALTHLWEKLLIPLLSKLSNLVVDGGIWMNTQRPEWNDANNALPGYGLSVVTLAHTLRYARFLLKLTADRTQPITAAPIVRRWFERVAEVLRDLIDQPSPISPALRRETMDRLGDAFSEYREAAYAAWPTAAAPLSIETVVGFLNDAAAVLERSFRANRREDGLFHSYNTMTIEPHAVHVHRLGLMLEGQVAALDAQVLSPQEAVALVRAMYDSPIYRPDQHSFLLYPDRTLPDFEARNCVSADAVRHIAAVDHWRQANDGRIIAADGNGTLHFNADLKNAEVLQSRLDALEATPGWTPITDADRAALLDVYEETFRHAEFTGRSASMYGYEGLGCVYWHMVAKLLLAVQESYARARTENAARAELDALAAAYHRVRSGFNYKKSPSEYGAFPVDAYSHTPGHSGAQQPGMTGQVKEQVLTRFGELGVTIQQGQLTFDPTLLVEDERLQAPYTWTFIGTDGKSHVVHVPQGGVAFMLAGVAVIYNAVSSADAEGIRVVGRDGEIWKGSAPQLDAERTRQVLTRSGSVAKIEVDLHAGRFMAQPADGR